MRIIMTLIALVVIAEALLMLAVYIGGQWPRSPQNADAIIVLGARVMPSGELSTALEHRVEKALEVYQEGYAPYIIVCGAQGANEPITEARAMADFFIGHGVPQDRVLLDEQSRDTVQNIQNAVALMQPLGLQSAVIVTSEYHLTRALWIARDEGLAASGVTCLGQNLRRNRIKAHFRETLSWMNYFTGGLLGRISGLREGGGE